MVSLKVQRRRVNVERKERRDAFQKYAEWYLCEVERIDKGNKDAFSAGCSRFGKDIRELLAFAGGDYEKAKTATISIGRYLQAKNLDWKVRTISGYYNDWLRDPKRFDA